MANADKQEEQSASSDDSSLLAGVDEKRSKGKERRSRPLAPACNISLIRDDLSTIWCELTSSIRTRSPNDMDKKLIIELPLPPTEAVAASSHPKTSNKIDGRHRHLLVFSTRQKKIARTTWPWRSRQTIINISTISHQKKTHQICCPIWSSRLLVPLFLHRQT